MDARELRIGNIVHAFKTDYTIDSSDFEGEKISTYKPVALTEEWHNKFGIKKDGFNSFRYVLKNKLNLFITIVFSGDYVMLMQGDKHNDDCVSIWNTDLTKRNLYVHEFQNLYFQLSGEELELN